MREPKWNPYERLYHTGLHHLELGTLYYYSIIDVDIPKHYQAWNEGSYACPVCSSDDTCATLSNREGYCICRFCDTAFVYTIAVCPTCKAGHMTLISEQIAQCSWCREEWTTESLVEEYKIE